ncbi:hypothetical protein ACWGMA_30915 [Streptomyces asiaticus]
MEGTSPGQERRADRRDAAGATWAVVSYNCGVDDWGLGGQQLHQVSQGSGGAGGEL